MMRLRRGYGKEVGEVLGLGNSRVLEN